MSSNEDEDLTSSVTEWQGRSPLRFFLLVFALSVPFWLIGAVSGLELSPGVPVAALMAVCPTLAAVLLVYREQKATGVSALLRRAFDFKRTAAKVWYIPTLLVMPGVMTVSYIVLRLTGVPVPSPQIAILPALVLCVLVFLLALAEELGWSGYAIDPLQGRWGALAGSVAVGLVWAIWHYVALAQAHRSIEWIAWWSLGTVAQRVIIVWLYNNTGKSVFAAALFHMSSNLTWQLFPVHGSYYDPRVTGVITAIVATSVVLAWGPRRLACSPRLTFQKG
jgi:membrane protease YdiL (CAAX protease family)